MAAPFLSIYFGAALITTSELAEVAAIDIGGLPLGFYAGVAVIISGVIIARIYLLTQSKSGG